MRPGAILFDLDGTIFDGIDLVPGTSELMGLLDTTSIPYHFITNTTRMSKNALANMVSDMGLKINKNHIFAASYAALIYCQNMGFSKIFLAVQDKELEKDFKGLQLVDKNPEAIVLGDMGPEFSFDFLNMVFNYMMDGAHLVAMHKNLYWQSVDGLTLDIGAFVSALEYSSKKVAAVIGKPSPLLFRIASQTWNLPPDQIYVIGDDVFSDVLGAAGVGMKSVLVKTGKYRPGDELSISNKPDYIINSVADLNNILDLC